MIPAFRPGIGQVTMIPAFRSGTGQVTMIQHLGQEQDKLL